MKPIKKYTLKFLNIGKDKKVALRYFCTCDGIGKTADFSCNVILSREDVVKLNQGNLDGMVIYSNGAYNLYFYQNQSK